MTADIRQIQISTYPTHNPSNLTFDVKGWSHWAVTTITGPITAFLAPQLNPALSKKPAELDPLRAELLSGQPHKMAFQHTHVQRLSIETPDHATLDGVIVHGNDVGQGPVDYSSRKVIFLVLGAGGAYEAIANPEDAAHDFMKYLQDAVSANIDILVINPRGIGQSKGVASYEGWSLDVYSSLKALTNLGYAPENIALVGHSMGAWIAAEAMHSFQTELPAGQQKPAYLNYNSLDSMADVVRVHAGPVGAAAARLARATGWAASVSSTVEALPHDRTLIAHVTDDAFITAPIRLTTKIKDSVDPSILMAVPLVGTDASKAHIQVPDLNVAAWLKRALHIATTDAVARASLT